MREYDNVLQRNEPCDVDDLTGPGQEEPAMTVCIYHVFPFTCHSTTGETHLCDGTQTYCRVGCCRFLFDNLREKRSVPRSKSRVACFKNSCGVPVEMTSLKSSSKGA